MKPIKAKKNFTLKGIAYEVGDEVRPDNIDELVKLNEGGFIEPLTPKQIQDYFKKPEVKKIFKKEEE